MPRISALLWLKKLDSFIEKIESWSLILMLSVMMVVAFIQVVLRNFFSTGITWGDGLTRALVLWTALIGASVAVRQGRYINVDAFSRLLGAKAKRVVRLIIYIFSIVVCFLLGRASVTFVEMEREAGNVYSIGVASWIVELIIPAAFFFMSFRFFLKALALVMGEELEKQEWER